MVVALRNLVSAGGLFGKRKMPNPSHLSAYWHQPQFSKLYDAKTRRECVAMLFSVPEQLFDPDDPAGPDPVQIGLLSREIERYVHSQWAQSEAVKTAKWFASHGVTALVVILEHAATGAYATRTQQVKAYYNFDGEMIGDATPAGHIYENETVFQCLTI